MRLIDADGLEELIYTLIKSWDKNMPYGGGRIDSYMFVISAIKQAPTIETSIEHFVDLEQIKKAADIIRPQGKWICDTRYLDCRCSICNSSPLDSGDYPELSPYCPQCGAKMEMPDEK